MRFLTRTANSETPSPPNTIIGLGTTFRGTLMVAGTLRIEGELEGDVLRCERLEIGEHGVMRADIEVMKQFDGAQFLPETLCFSVGFRHLMESGFPILVRPTGRHQMPCLWIEVFNHAGMSADVQKCRLALIRPAIGGEPFIKDGVANSGRCEGKRVVHGNLAVRTV